MTRTTLDAKYYRVTDIMDAITDMRANIAIRFATLPSMKEQNATRKEVRKRLDVLQNSINALDYMSCVFIGHSPLLGFYQAFAGIGLNFHQLLHTLRSYTQDQAYHTQD